MPWQITEQNALFAIFILAFAWSGYRRGWKRETVSLLYIVLGLVFLFLSGGVYLAKLLYQFLFDQQLINSNSKFAQITTFIAVVVIIGLGYIIGRRAYSFPTFPQDRVLGIIPGAIAGALVAAYVTYSLFPSTQTTVISAGTLYTNLLPNLMANFTVVVIFLIALVAIFIGLVAIRLKKDTTLTTTTEAKKKGP